MADLGKALADRPSFYVVWIFGVQPFGWEKHSVDDWNPRFNVSSSYGTGRHKMRQQ